METALKSQLNKLKLSQKSQAILPTRSEASFLFDLEHSKRIDMDTIYEIGYSGLIDLARHKQNFVKYFNSLFNSTSKYFNREVKKADELKLVDEDINELLVQLIPFFRHKPTHRILEYLVRIFNINVYNRKILLFSFLPYHETKLFTKLIQIMNIDQFNHLKFFTSYSKEGKVVLKENLYKELSSNFDFLREIFNFYEDHVLTNKTVGLDDTAYFNFIFEICEYLLKNSAKVMVDVNRLNLMIQFLNKIFQFFKNKMTSFNKGNSDDEGEYETTLVSGLCGLVGTLMTRLSISSEYKKAFLNDLVNKMLIHLDTQASIENIIRTILIILNDSSSTSKGNPQSVLLGKETLTNLEEFYSKRKNSRQILRNISNSHSSDFTLLIKTILLSSQEHMTLVKNLIRDNNFNEENLQKLIQFLYDQIIANRNNEYIQLLNYIEEIHSEMFNSILVTLYTSTKDRNYLTRLQEVTKDINNDFHKLLSKSDSNADSAEINAFNLFLNLNQTNMTTTLASIRKIDDILDLKETDQKDFLMRKIVPSLTNKFSSLDKEIILNEIVNLKHLPQLLSGYALFRQEYQNFFFTLNTRQIDLYSPEFLEKYVHSLVTYLVDEKDCLSLKTIVYLVLFRFNADVKLFGLNTFTKRLFSCDLESFVNYLSSHSNENINSIKFMEIIKELLENLKLNKGRKFNSDLMFELIEKIVFKEKEKLSFIKTIFYQQLQIIVDILKLDLFKSKEADYFNQLSTIFINVVKSVPNISELYLGERAIRKIIDDCSILLLSSNNFTGFDRLSLSMFKTSENTQKFLAHTILNLNNLSENFYEYLKNKISSWEFAEACLTSALIYALSISKDFKSSGAIIHIIRELNSKKLHTTNFNIFSESTESQIVFDENLSNAFINMVDELLSRKNEILSNNANVKKFISTQIREDNLEIIFLTFIKGTNSLNIKSVSKIIDLFSGCNKNNNKMSQAKYVQLFDISREFLKTLTAGDSIIFQYETDYRDFINLTEMIFENLMNTYQKSSLEIAEIILTLSSKLKFNQAFIEKLFSKENFEVSAEIQKNLPQLHKIIKLAMSYSISPDSFITYDDQFCLSLLDYIQQENLIENPENESFIYFAFEIIFKSKNYYFDIGFIKSTAELLYTINLEKEEASYDCNSVYLNLSNNLLTIIANSTVESEQKIGLKSIIDKLEQIIFFLVKKFRGADIQASHSLELAHVMNTLFLCINKLIALFDFINEEKEFVKNLIMRCLEILNEKRFKENEEDVVMTDLTQKTKEEVYLVFLNAIKNFIELVFSKQNSQSKSSNCHDSVQNYNTNSIFYEYIHYFVKFSIINLKDEKILKMFLTNFLQISMIYSNENFLACYFVDLYYFTIEMNQEGVAHDSLYSEIIFNFFKGDEDDSKIKSQMPKSLKVIQSIFEELNANRNNSSIFCLEQEDAKVRPDPNFIAINLISKIFILIEDNFGYFEKSDETPLLNTILKICSSINLNRRITTGKMRNNEDSSDVKNEIFKIHLKELKSFEKQLFSALNESKIIYNAILLIYLDTEEESKNMRSYLLNKFYELIITKENFDSVNVSNLFEFFIQSMRKEDRVENLQLIFSILTKITQVRDATEIFKFLKISNNFDYILSLVKFSNGENHKNLQTQFYHFSILVFLTKIFNILPQNKFLDKFNLFLKTFLKGFDVVLAIDNEDLTILILETFDYLSQNKAEFYSPYLSEILYKILLITNKIQAKQNNSPKIFNLVSKTFEIIAKKQLFDNSFKSVKYCIESLTKSEEQTQGETFKIIFNFFKTSIEQIDRVVMADVYEKIFKFVVKLLINEKMNQKLSEYILDCLRTYVLKINEKQLRTIFQNILIFAKEKSEGETSLKYKLENSIVTFQILNTILQSITIVFVPYFEKYKGYWTDLANSVCSLFSSEDKRNSNKKKKGRADFDECYDDAEKTFSYLKLNTLLLENIKYVFKFNKENSLLNETIEDLSESLMGQLKFIFFESFEEKYLNYFDKEIKVCFLEIFKNLRSDDHLKEFNDSILNLIREDHYLIKLLALKMIFALFQELKERYITLLSNILPYVSECLEDSNEKVHQEAFKIMKYVEKETGEDLKYYIEG